MSDVGKIAIDVNVDDSSHQGREPHLTRSLLFFMSLTIQLQVVSRAVAALATQHEQANRHSEVLLLPSQPFPPPCSSFNDFNPIPGPLIY